jgi:hypothetical protein
VKKGRIRDDVKEAREKWKKKDKMDNNKEMKKEKGIGKR